MVGGVSKAQCVILLIVIVSLLMSIGPTACILKEDCTGTSIARANDEHDPKANSTSLTNDESTFVMAETWEPESIDPAAYWDEAGGEVIQNTYETLVWYDQGSAMVLVPWLASELPTLTNGGISPDGLHYTIHLRSGVRFHDGGVMTADDVVYSFKRVLAMNVIGSSAWTLGQVLIPNYTSTGDPVDLMLIDGAIEKLSLDTIRFNLAIPYSGFLYILATPISSIVSKEFVESHGGYSELTISDYLTNHECGTGPYAMKIWSDGSKIELQRFNDYRRGPASIKAVEIIFVPGSFEREAMLRAGNASSVSASNTMASNLIGAPGVRVLEGLPLLSLELFAFNQNIMPGLDIGDVGGDFFDILEIRQAFIHAFDYTAYRSYINVTGQHPIRSNGPIPKGMFGQDAAVPFSEFNLTEAAEFLTKAKDGRTPQPNDTYAENGFQIVLYYHARSIISSSYIGLLIMKRGLENLSQNATYGVAGKISIDIRALSWSEYIGAWAGHELPIKSLGFRADYADPDVSVREFCDGNGSCASHIGISNQTLTDLVARGSMELDSSTRERIYTQISWSCYDNAYYLWTDQPTVCHVERTRVQEHYYNPMHYGLYYYGLAFLPHLPSEPTHFQVMAGNGYVQLNWSPPNSTGGVPVKNYAVYRGTANHTLFPLVNVTEVHYRDTNVTNDQRYYYAVAAVTEFGEGNWTPCLSATPSTSVEGTDWSSIFIASVTILLGVVILSIFARSGKR